MAPSGPGAEIEARRNVPAIGNVAKSTRRDFIEWMFRNDGYPVIALLPMHRLMSVASIGQRLFRELIVHAFDLLQAQYIGTVLGQKIENDGQAQPHRIDVPGGKRRHEGLGGG